MPPEPASRPAATATSPDSGAEAPKVQSLGPGRWQVGQVRIDQPTRSISFPAAVNQRDGPVEYLLSAAHGKLHESVLRTDVQPVHIQVALLLLGARGAADVNPSTYIDPGRKIPGEALDIEVAWTADGKTNATHAESLVLDLRSGRAMTRGPWIFNGSQITARGFHAQLDGNLVSIMTDPSALVNNPRPGREDDECWRVATNTAPAVGTPMTVRFVLAESADSRAPVAGR